MDESWRMPMSASHPSRRRSTEQASVYADSSETFDPEDFADVFGGPPRSVYWRKLSGDFAGAASNSFYDEIFRPPENLNSGGIGRRGLPAFRIPGGSDLRFYGDVFGSDRHGGDERRSRERSRPNSKAKSKSKSKSTSSSVLSSEEMSPLRPVIGDHVAFSDLASKLRPINVPCRRSSSTTLNHAEETASRRQGTSIPTFFYGHRPSFVEPQYVETENINNWNTLGRSSSQYFGFSRRVSSPEIISLEPDSYPSVKISLDDVELNSPGSSAVSSLCHDGATNQAKSETRESHVATEEDEEEEEEVDNQVEEEDDDEDDDDEVMSSYVIEIGSDHREGTSDNAIGIDEAIAWAKEKFQTHSSSEKDLNIREKEDKGSAKVVGGRPNVPDFAQEQMDNKHGIVQSPKLEMRLQDENIRLWSGGKETDIRLLLSTLHYILWPNSGWSAMSLTSLIESSQVKKAYQKARLCLHPDKLQQRGVTLPQKYVADKAFSILQDAWASFISQDVCFTG
ncbi:DnaJ domain containing protein [Trema orientale]|uniref:DnaJ domain containing protein n=1 Tax=Trema orientale TaxID=63057 RepID=A0A2P5E9X3_TREOI|nr:DnaJ domain containing protein [Trema orientale]